MRSRDQIVANNSCVVASGKNARTALSEQDVNVLFVAFGFLKWFEAEHSDEPRLSPLLLVPVCLERIGATAP